MKSNFHNFSHSPRAPPSNAKDGHEGPYTSANWDEYLQAAIPAFVRHLANRQTERNLINQAQRNAKTGGQGMEAKQITAACGDVVHLPASQACPNCNVHLAQLQVRT